MNIFRLASHSYSRSPPSQQPAPETTESMRMGRRRAPSRALCSLGDTMQLSRLVLLILVLIIGSNHRSVTTASVFSTARSASMSSAVLSSSSSRRFLWRTSKNPKKKKSLLDVQPQLSTLLLLRGGSTAVLQQSEGSSPQEQQQLQSYRLQQQLYLQSRSVQLRQALIQRGLDELQLTAKDPSATVVQEVDWDCALSTEEHPYGCLYSFDAEAGAKVLGPVNTTKDWITLTALNRLRRHDPTKVEPLWHSKHPILRTWFAPSRRRRTRTRCTRTFPRSEARWRCCWTPPGCWPWSWAPASRWACW